MSHIAQFVLHLRPHHPANVPVWLGRAAQAWFLDSLRQLHPDLAEATHDQSQLKPFTVSTLLPVVSGELQSLSPSRTYQLRLTTLHADLTRITQALLPRWMDAPICLHNQAFEVRSVDVDQLETQSLLDKARSQRLPRQLRFNFISPTVFKRTGDLQMPIPDPVLVFGSLMQRWQGFDHPALSDDLREFVLRHVEIKRYDLKTTEVSFQRGKQASYNGFSGQVDFFVQSGDRQRLAELHALTAFAPFSGVGARTTWGLGQVSTVTVVKHQPEGKQNE